jgi:hypothetical protein
VDDIDVDGARTFVSQEDSYELVFSIASSMAFKTPCASKPALLERS